MGPRPKPGRSRRGSRGRKTTTAKSTVGPNGPGKENKKRVVSGKAIKEMRMSVRLSGIEQWQKASIDQEQARARVIMDITFSVNGMARTLSSETMLVFDQDILEFAKMNPDDTLTVRDLIDLLKPVPVVSMERLNEERQKCLLEFHEEEQKRRKIEEKQQADIAEALKDKTLGDLCPQCELPYSEEPCSPIHAVIKGQMEALEEAKNASTSDSEVPAIEVSDGTPHVCQMCLGELPEVVEDCPLCGMPTGLTDVELPVAEV